MGIGVLCACAVVPNAQNNAFRAHSAAILSMFFIRLPITHPVYLPLIARIHNSDSADLTGNPERLNSSLTVTPTPSVAPRPQLHVRQDPPKT